MPMNRQRSLPVTDFTDPRLSSLPPEVRLTATGLRMYADDEGREQVRLRPMVAEIYEHDEAMTSERMQTHLLSLADAGWLMLYPAEGIALFQIRTWPPVQHAAPSRFPPPEGFMKPSRGAQETFTAVARARASACEGGGAGERVGAGAPGASGHPSRDPHDDAPRPPSPFCSQHQPYGTEESCGPCRTARMAHDIWQESALRVQLPTGGRPSTEDPTEFVDEHGRIETT